MMLLVVGRRSHLVRSGNSDNRVAERQSHHHHHHRDCYWLRTMMTMMAVVNHRHPLRGFRDKKSSSLRAIHIHDDRHRDFQIPTHHISEHPDHIFVDTIPVYRSPIRSHTRRNSLDDRQYLPDHTSAVVVLVLVLVLVLLVRARVVRPVVILVVTVFV